MRRLVIVIAVAVTMGTGLATQPRSNAVYAQSEPPDKSSSRLLQAPTGASNVLLGLADSSLKASAVESGLEKSKAADGSMSTRWSPPNFQGPSANHYWAANLADVYTAYEFRLRTASPSPSGDFASELDVYGSSDPSAWSWLPSSKVTGDPAANGWNLVGGYSGLSFPVDTGQITFSEPATYRYWLFLAVAGGTGSTDEFDVNEVELLALPARPDCVDEDLGTMITPSGSGERVTVEYDPRFLVDSEATTDFPGHTALIAGLIKQRAEEALDYYQGFGMATPAALTIEIKCQIEYWFVGLQPQPPGFTNSPDLVQLRASHIEGWFAQDVKNDFPAQGSVWNVPGAEWGGLVDHEMFHVVQWASSAGQLLPGLRVRWMNGDHTWTESPAVLAQDLFDETDDQDQLPSSYLAQLELFSTLRVPLDIPVHDLTDAPQYWFAGALQYWAERFGPQDVPNLEARAARFLDALARGPCCHTSEVVDFGRVITYDWDAGQYGPQAGAYGRAISALRDYYVAHFALRATNVSASEQARYAILDAETGHGLTPGLEPGGGVGQYPELGQIRDELDLNAGPDTVTDDLPATQGEVYLIPVPAGTPDVELDISAAGVNDATADSTMRVAFVPVGADGSVVVDGALMPSAPRPGQTLTRTVGMTGRTALALVLVAGDRSVRYTVTARAVSGPVAIAIVEPSPADPYRVASALEPMILRARPTVGGDMPTSLAADSFELTIGGLHVDPTSAILRDGSYRIEGNIPNTLPAGTHPARLAYAGTEVDVPGGVTIDASLPPRQYPVQTVSFDAVGQGESESTVVIVAGAAGSASFSAEWTGSDFDLVLTAPSGRTIDEASTEPDVSVVQTANSVEIRVTEPEAGEWEVTATGVDVPTPEPLTLSAAEAATPVHGELVVEHGTAAGEPLIVSFALADELGAVADATVTVTLTDPAGQTLSIRLHDDGGHADGGAGDGVYGTTLWSTTAAGQYRLEVRAAGTDADGSPLMRYGSAAISLAPMVDTDGDGVSDAAEAAFGTDPADPDDADVDHDGDGLSLDAELTAALDPWSWDSDGGGEHDGSELAGGRDARLAGDDVAVPLPTVAARAEDGGLLNLTIGTADASGSVRLWRVEPDGGLVDLGSQPGAVTTLVDGPLPEGTYSYRAIGVAPSGAESAPIYSGPYRAAGDVTAPIFRLVANEGRWDTTTTEVGLRIADLTEPVTDMRIALSPDALSSAPWAAFSATSEVSLPAAEGQHLIYAQVRDAAGNVSAVTSSFVFLIDDTPPVSQAGPLAATYETPAIDVPFTASDDRSEVATVELWWRSRLTSMSPWAAWTLGPSGDTSPLSFSLQGSGEYEFYTVAIDGAGNREAAPDAADAATTVLDDSPIWTWGRNASGTLGVATQEVCGGTACSTVPVQAPGLGEMVDVDAGQNHNIGLAADGTVWTWGFGGAGQLGRTGSFAPAPVPNLANVIDVAGGGDHSLAVKSDGTVWAWGNQPGGIGDGTTNATSEHPIQVVGLSDVVRVEAGGEHSLALKSNGTLWAWGRNISGQLGDNSTTSRPTPVQVQVITAVVDMAGGGRHSIAVLADGTVWVWGENASGQLGIGNTQDKKRPTRVNELAGSVDVAAGPNHTVARHADGTLRAWGYNGKGQLGDGTTINSTSPVGVVGITNVTSIAAGEWHTVAIRDDGTVWGWGWGFYGTLDSGSTADHATPTRMAPAIDTATSIDAGSLHVVVIAPPP